MLSYNCRSLPFAQPQVNSNPPPALNDAILDKSSTSIERPAATSNIKSTVSLPTASPTSTVTAENADTTNLPKADEMDIDRPSQTLNHASTDQSEIENTVSLTQEAHKMEDVRSTADVQTKTNAQAVDERSMAPMDPQAIAGVQAMSDVQTTTNAPAVADKQSTAPMDPQATTGAQAIANVQTDVPEVVDVQTDVREAADSQAMPGDHSKTNGLAIDGVGAKDDVDAGM